MKRGHIPLPRPVEVVEIDGYVYAGFAFGFSFERSEYGLPRFVIVFGPFAVLLTFGYPF